MKLTGERLEAFLSGLRLGMTRRAASAAVGISKSTLYRMLAEEDPDGTLLDSIEKAEAEAEATYTALVAKAASEPKNWTAAAWWLERRRSADFARHDKVEMTVDLKREAEKIAAEMGLDPDEVLREAQAILKGSA